MPDKQIDQRTFPLGGGFRAAFVDILGPASYAQGGDTINARDYGFTFITHVSGGIDKSGAYAVHGVTHATQGSEKTSIKLMWRTIAGPEPADTTNLSALWVRVMIIGR